MSVDYSSTAIIGCQITQLENLWEKILTYTCDHLQKDGAIFCPICGKKSGIITVFKKLFGEEKDEYFTKEHLENWGMGYYANELTFSIITGTDDKNPVAGFIITKEPKWGSDNHGFISLNHNIADIKKATKAILEPLGLWNEDNFGLYSVLSCSY